MSLTSAVGEIRNCLFVTTERDLTDSHVTSFLGYIGETPSSNVLVVAHTFKLLPGV